MAFKWYPGKKKELEDDVRIALELTAEAIRTDLVASQTLPFAEDSEENYRRGVVPGQLQGSVHLDRSDSRRGKVAVVTSTPYARRLYYHPEYNYYRGTNPQAGGLWYEPYRNGNKRTFAADEFQKIIKQRRNKR